MTPEEQLYARILAAPEDDQPRRAYGELLSQRGDPRGELIRVQLQIAELYRAMGPRDLLAALTMREDELIAAHEDEWLADIAPLVTSASLSRGFVDMVTLDAKRFVETAPKLYEVAPVLHLALEGAAPVMGELTSSPHLARIVSMNLERQQIGDDGARAIAASEYLDRLAWLNLDDNAVGQPGLEALVASTRLPSLAWVGFRTNRVDDPSDRPADYDEDVITAWKPSPLGEALEARFGRKPWLHYQTDLAIYHPPAEVMFVSGTGSRRAKPGRYPGAV